MRASSSPLMIDGLDIAMPVGTRLTFKATFSNATQAEGFFIIAPSATVDLFPIKLPFLIAYHQIPAKYMVTNVLAQGRLLVWWVSVWAYQCLERTYTELG